MMQMEVYSGSMTVVRDKVNKFLKTGITVFNTHVTKEETAYTVTIFYFPVSNIEISYGPSDSITSGGITGPNGNAGMGAMAAASIPKAKIPEIKIDPIADQIAKQINESMNRPLTDLAKVKVGDMTLGMKN